VYFITGHGTSCTGGAVAGECGSETTCSLNDDTGSMYVDLAFAPCGSGWCASDVHVGRSALSVPPCLVSWGADYALNDAIEAAYVATLEATVWECP
jgi:hypothetical protein